MATVMVMETTMVFRLSATLIMLSSVTLTTVNASGLKIVPSIDINQIYTDNLNVRGEATDSDQITGLQAQIGLSNQGSLVESYLKYQYLHLEYHRQKELSHALTNYDGKLLIKLLDNRFRTVISSSKKRQQSSIYQPATRYSSTGRTEVVRYGINNSWQSRLSDVLNYRVNWQLNKSEASSINDVEDVALPDAEDNYVSISLKSGRFFNNSYWSLRAEQAHIDYDALRNIAPAGQKFSNLKAEIGHDIGYDLSFFSQYYDEEYDVNNHLSSQLVASSVGAGLRWLPTSRSSFKLAYNWSLDDLNSNFISAAINWRPNNRTSLMLSSSKRFFGDAYEAKLSHRHKRIFTSISYEESITNFQVSTLSPTTVGHFICPNSTEISLEQCTFAEGIAPTIGSGQQLFPVPGLAPELSDVTYLNKQLNANISYQLRKANIQFNFLKSRRKALDTLVIREREALTLTASYTLSRHNTFSLISTFEDYSTLNQSSSSIDYQQQDHSLRFSHKISPTLSTTLLMMHSERQANYSANDFRENRLNLSLSKEF